MPAVQDIDGAVVRLWLRLAADELDRARAAIDVINVFPVADADTGTNMHKTIAYAADALAGLPEHASTADIWQAAAAAALQGACGNSGIILSQLLCGLADTCGPASPCDGQVVALALAKAAALARAAVHRPVEGTVLTVADAAARAAAHAAAQPADLPVVGQAAATGAREALLGTRQQLEVLAASGVVDAGGAGLCVLLDALSAAISGRRGSFTVPVPVHRTSAVPAGRAASEFSYEVTYLLDAAEDAVAVLRDRLDLLGDSLVVSGRAPRWHVHIHVADAGAVIETGLTAGQLSKITITYLNQAHPGIAPARPTHAAVVAVAAGDGLADLLRAAGATVVRGAAELEGLRDELASEPAPAVLLAPGGRFAERWPPGWPVLETGSEIQLLAALAVHDPQHDQDADLAAMSQAVAGMRWGAVRRSEPDDEPGRAASPGPGPFTGSLAGEPVVAGHKAAGVAVAVTDVLLTSDTEMLTLVTGKGASPGLAGLVADHAAGHAAGVEVICYDGGMTDSLLLIGAE
jgi:DAK2 domain fusion protein YloV